MTINDVMTPDITQTNNKLTQKFNRLNDDSNLMSNLASHGLKSPLNVIATYCTTLEDKLKGTSLGEELAWVRVIHQQADHMRDMIAVLFEYLSIENGSEKPRRPVDTNQVIAGVLANAKLAAQSSSVNITYDTLPPVMGREKQTALLFANLIDNAIKFRNNNAPSIHISATHKEGKMIEFSIADNGIGIDEAFHEIIFILFQKLNPEQYPGLGAGLALCKKIVECSGGNIRVESTVGAGSTFFFTLPEA